MKISSGQGELFHKWTSRTCSECRAWPGTCPAKVCHVILREARSSDSVVSTMVKHTAGAQPIPMTWLRYWYMLEQARKGNSWISADKDHFTNYQWGSLLQISNQKCTENVERNIKTSDMALLLVDLVESFAIVNWNYHPQRSHWLFPTEFPLTHCSLPHTHGICSGQPSTLTIWCTLLCSAYQFTVIPISACIW